jgi:HEAT repeat protein/ATP/ADP translocase
MRNRLLSLFNIRSNEAWLVTNLFWLQFFQGAGVAVFNTVAFALFLGQFDIHELPKVYLFSAVLLWLTGWAYSKFEHAVHIKHLVPAVIVAVALSILAFRLQFVFTDSPLFVFVMFSWYYVIYLLTNLEFWGVAALLFDIRQSKRLFGMIGAGDIPAKLIGYSAVPVLIPFIGSYNLLILAFALILCSLFFYVRLKRAGKLDIHVAHEHHHEEHATQSLTELVKGFFGNRMIAMVAGLSFVVVVCVTVISFSFYSEIKHEAKANEDLASFIAMFYAGGRILAIFIRLIFTGRITSILGIKGSLLVSPVILFVFFVAIILFPLFSHNPHSVIYIFGIMAIVTEVLKTSLQDPVFLSLMQPLSSGLRLKGHTIVKGVMDPFALAFTGFMLFGLLKVSGKVDLLLLSYLLFTLLVIWVAMIFLVDKEYVKTLVTALHRRYSVGQEINLEDDKTKAVLLEKLSNGERGEAIYILNLFDRQYSDDKQELILKGLAHPVQEVKMEALKVIERRKIQAAIPFIEQVIQQKENPQILAEAVKAKCMLQTDEVESMEQFLNDPDERIVRASIVGFMTSGGIGAVVTAGQKLLTLIASQHPHERKLAAEIIGELGIPSFYKPLLTLLSDSYVEVAKAAVVAAGNVRSDKLTQELMRFFTQKRFDKQALEALYNCGDKVLPVVKHALLTKKLSHQQQSKLILLCGRIGSDAATQLLDELVWQLPSLRRMIFHALHLCEFKPLPANRTRHIELMNEYMNSAIRILFMINELPNTKTANVLADALKLELNEIRDSMLLLFSFVYDTEKMLRARNAFQMNKKESIANALEIVEISVPKEISLRFMIAFEPSDVAERCVALKPYFKETLTYESIVDDILNNTTHHYHRWTKATALHSLIFYKGERKLRWLNAAQAQTDILLNETAGRILAEMN